MGTLSRSRWALSSVFLFQSPGVDLVPPEFDWGLGSPMEWAEAREGPWDSLALV